MTTASLSVHGLPAYGYENDHPGGYVHVGSSTDGSIFRSVVVWHEQGIEYFLASVSIWSMKRLAAMANSCTMTDPSPEPLFPTSAILPTNRLTSVDWSRPLDGGFPVSTSGALSGLKGAFLPRLGTPVGAFSESFGTSRHPSHLIVFVFDEPRAGRILVFEHPAQTSLEEFKTSIGLIAHNKGPLGSTGYYKVTTIRGGLPALVSVANGGAPWTVEWLENGLDVIVAGKSVSAEQAIALASRV